MDIENGEELFDSMSQRVITKLEITNLDPSEDLTVETIVEHKKVCDFHREIILEMNKLTDQNFLNMYAYLNTE